MHDFIDPDEYQAHCAYLSERAEMIDLLLDYVNKQRTGDDPCPAWFDGPCPEFDSIDDDEVVPIRTYDREFGPAEVGWSVRVVAQDYALDHGLDRSQSRIYVEIPDWAEFNGNDARAIAAALIAAADALDRE